MPHTSSVLEACLAELSAALESLEPELAGLLDQLALPDSPATVGALESQIAAFARRKELLQAAMTALLGLKADGYPEVAVLDVASEVFDELARHLAEVEAALAHFRPKVRVMEPTNTQAEVVYATAGKKE